VSSTTRSRARPSGLIQELLFAGMFLWISVISGTSLVETDQPTSYPLLVVVTLFTGASALLLTRSALGRWRGGERIALVHAGPVIGAIEMAIGVSICSSAVEMARHASWLSALIGVAGVGLLLAGVLDVVHWVRGRTKRLRTSH
jgi:hypothetical protein